MSQQFGQRQFPAGNPLANALVVIVGALVIGASVVLGLVAFVVLGSVVAILAAIIGIRVWWLRRRMQKQFGGDDAGQSPTATGARVIEGEYRVVTREERRSDGD